MSALQKAEQAAWEAPELRPTFTRDGDTEKWSEPCPDWCTGEGEGHDAYRVVQGRGRQHQSHALTVRQDAGLGYEDCQGGADGVRAAHLAVSLVAGSRNPQTTTRVAIDVRFGRLVDGEPRSKEFSLSPLYPDEARELITVLQHLLKVAGA